MITSDLDKYLKSYGVKYTHLESGKISVDDKLKEIGCVCKRTCSEKPCLSLVKKIKEICGGTPTCWVELSWGSGSYKRDKFDFAIVEFGKTPGQAIQNTINVFIDFVKRTSLNAVISPNILKYMKE